MGIDTVRNDDHAPAPRGPAPHVTCSHHGCSRDHHDTWATWPNLVTGLRVAAVLALCTVAVGRQDAMPWLVAALATYWLLDIADGALARALDRETHTGAMLDSLGDRLSMMVIVAVYVAEVPAAAVPAALLLFQFAFLDAYLSTMFRRWSLLSPNYFYLVDRWTYRATWSPLAKSLNTSAAIAVWLATGNPAATCAVVLAFLVAKVVVIVRVTDLAAPIMRTGCVMDDAAGYRAV